jgi:heptosyltransferase-1
MMNLICSASIANAIVKWFFMKIAIVKLSALGDIVHAMIALQFIKKHYQEALIDWVVEEGFDGILENNPHINQIHRINLQAVKQSKSLYALWNEFKKIRKFGKYDLVIDMQGLIKSALVARTISSNITLGFDKFSLRESLAAKFYNQTYKIDYAENVIERNLSLASYALKFSFDKEDIHSKEVFLYPTQQYAFDYISSAKKNILLIPGASYPAKCYPIEKFVELTKQINAHFLTIWGNEKERIIANQIKHLSSNIEVLEELSLDSLISLITQVDLVIGPDTGPTHMAWALNVPSITLFGPTPGYRNTYATNINKIIESRSKVNPSKINKNDYSINSIKVGDIVKLAQKLLMVSK